jgi:hypothetical protein
LSRPSRRAITSAPPASSSSMNSYRVTARLLPGGAGMQLKVAVPPREADGMIAMVRDVSVAVGWAAAWAAAAAVTVAVAVPAGMGAAWIAVLLAAELAGFLALGAVERISRRPRSQGARDMGSARRVLPRPAAHAAASAATRRISPTSAAAARASARLEACAERRSHSRSRASSAGHRRTAAHSHHFSMN